MSPVPTVLFFGDSNTRGYGVGRELRYASRLENAWRAQPANEAWRFVVAHSESDFRQIRPRIEQAVEREDPQLLVLQCPTGPACHFVALPPWARVLRRPFERLLERRRARHVAAATRRAPDRYASPREVHYDGLYLDPLFRRDPRKWPGLRNLNRILVRRYGLETKATLERYVELMLDVRSRVRARSEAEIVFLGLLSADERVFPGYRARVAEWIPRLQAVLHDPDRGDHFVDPVARLGWTVEDVLLSDGTHLSALGHRCVAEALQPTLFALLRHAGSSAATRRAPRRT